MGAIRTTEKDWDKKLNIDTCGRDASKEDAYHYPYEPTPYSVLERLAESEYISYLMTVPKLCFVDEIDEKKSFLLEHHIAVWDVIESCTIIGSSDSSIKDVVVNDFSKVLENSVIDTIYVNGGKAYDLYHKYAEKQTGIQAIKLPSTSPANAAWSLERLYSEWKKITE